MIRITDVPGKISQNDIRIAFEEMVRSEPLITHTTPLGTISINGGFSHYANSITDTMFIGFALGMRRMERKLKEISDEKT